MSTESERAAKRRWVRGYIERNHMSILIYRQLMAIAFPEEHAAKKHRSYVKHIDKYREWRRAWKKANHDRCNELSRLAHRRNPSLAMDRQRRWRKNHPDKAREMKARRRFRPLPEVSVKIAAIYSRAVELCRWFAVEVDHIIPLARGGTHVPDNLQIIYGFENKRKHVNPNYKPKVVFT